MNYKHNVKVEVTNITEEAKQIEIIISTMIVSVSIDNNHVFQVVLTVRESSDCVDSNNESIPHVLSMDLGQVPNEYQNLAAVSVSKMCTDKGYVMSLERLQFSGISQDTLNYLKG